MNKEVKKILIVQSSQFLINLLSVIGAIAYRSSYPSWPFYLILLGILLSYFIPLNYRLIYSTESGILLKNHTRKLENILMTLFTTICILFITYLQVV